MRIRFWQSVFVSSFVAVSASGLAHTAAQAPAAATPMTEMQPETKATPAGPLKVTYNGKTEEWTAATLASLPHSTIKVYNEHAKMEQTYSGVPLIVLLTRLGVPEKPHGNDFRLYLVAEGSDGYQVAYSVGEVTPDVHDGTTLVADAMDGKPITGSGPLQLVTTGEKRPARWVRNLVSVRALPIQ